MHNSLRYCLAAAAVLTCGAAQADDVNLPDQPGDGQLAVGVGVICNTTEQAEHYVHLRAGGAKIRPAMEQVNQAAQQPQACGLAAVAYRRDKTMDTQTVRGRVLSIVRIDVLGGFDGHQWRRVPAMIQYAVMEAKGEAI